MTTTLSALDSPTIMDMLTRPGIAGTAYDTAWVASVPEQDDRRSSRFPTALQWLIEHQRPDGSWGGGVRYEHDRILSTLAALAPLAAFGRRERDRDSVDAGVRYLWQHGHLLAHEPAELVGFELLLPALVDRARQAGITVPPHLDIYGTQRAEKLALIPAHALYSPRVTVVHSLEFLGDGADVERLGAAQGENGSLGNSPAATAFYLTHSNNANAERYLRRCLALNGGAMAPVLHPCETFELLWSAYHLFLAGVPAHQLLTLPERAALTRALTEGGVSLAPTFPIPDADDTAVALLLLHDFGQPVDPIVLQRFVQPGAGIFASFPYERHSSVGVNLHVLHALLRVPGYPEVQATIRRIVEYLIDQQIDGLYWIDKWHISPYYATAHVIRVLDELPTGERERIEPTIARAREWLRQTQNSDGSWGFYGQSTAEETAYALLALAHGEHGQCSPGDRRRCALGVQYLHTVQSREHPLPPLWIDKCLYTPTLVVGAAIEAAHFCCARLKHGSSVDQPTSALSPGRPLAKAIARV